MGFLIITGLTCLLTLGGAGMAQLMGKRISEMSGAKTTFGALVRGSIAYSVGVFFPVHRLVCAGPAVHFVRPGRGRRRLAAHPQSECGSRHAWLAASARVRRRVR